MNTENFYLNQVAKRTETGSDYAIAKLLQVSRSRISNYRTGASRFDEEMCIKVAQALALDPLEVIAAIYSEKARSETARRFWRETLHRITTTAAAVILAVACLVGFSHPSTAYADSERVDNIYYTQSRRRRALLAVLLAWFAWFPVCQAAEPLTGSEIAAESAFQILWYTDWKQTRDFTGRQPQFTESNPILGQHPAPDAVNRYFIIGGLLHLAVTRILPAKYRPTWQAITISFEAGTVTRNIRVGVHWSF